MLRWIANLAYDKRLNDPHGGHDGYFEILGPSAILFRKFVVHQYVTLHRCGEVRRRLDGANFGAGGTAYAAPELGEIFLLASDYDGYFVEGRVTSSLELFLLAAAGGPEPVTVVDQRPPGRQGKIVLFLQRPILAAFD